MSCALDLGLRDTHRVDALGCPSPSWFGSPNPAALLKLKYFGHGQFIGIVGQDWSINARLRTPLQRTVIQRDLPPGWPQLSKIAWDSVIS